MRCQTCHHEWRGNYGEPCPSCGNVAVNPFQASAAPPATPTGAPQASPSGHGEASGAEPNPWDRQVNFSEDAAPAEDGIPWEVEQSVSSAVDTIKGVLLKPAETFSSAWGGHSIGSAVIYMLILGTIGGVVSFGWQIALGQLDPLTAQMEISAAVILGAAVIGMPIAIIVGLFFGAGLVHLGLSLAGGANAGFETTLRVLAFASGSTAPLQIVPGIGGMVAWIWSLVAQVIGLREMHETTTGKAVFGALFPLILCCGCGIVIAIMAGGLAAVGG